MPDQTPNFFNVADLSQGKSRQLAEGMSTRVFGGSDAMISIVEIGPNKRGQIHSHSQEQWGLLLRGTGTRIQDGFEVAVVKGDFWRTPGGIEHGFIAGPEGATVYDVFAPPRPEYLGDGSGFSG
jgi:quercetin dioxygenase-like cupin family protein